MYSIQVTVKGRSEEEAREIGALLEVALQHLSAGLDLSPLRSIIVAADFDAELATIRTSSGNPVTYTKEEYARAYAKLVHLVKDGQFEMVLVLDPFIVDTLMSSKEDSVRFGLHMIRHELCHVHDGHVKSKCLSEYWLKHKLSGVAGFFFPIAEGIWSEYYATRHSTGTADQNSILNYVENLAEGLDRTKKIITEEITNYRTPGADLDHLVNTAIRHGGFLLTSAAYVHGYLAGLQQDLDSLSPQTDRLLKGSYFLSTWKKMGQVLTNMHDAYPSQWKSLSVYDGLMELAGEFFTGMGLEFEELPDKQVYVHVPYSPDTMPG